MEPPEMSRLLDQHGRLTDDLAQARRELGDLRSAHALARRNAWNETAHLPITERRETLTAHTADLTGEIEVLLGEVEALQVQLAHLALRIEHG